MAVSFSTKDDRKELSLLSAKLATARAENQTLKTDLNDCRNLVADSTAVTEAARADTAEAALVRRDRELSETQQALKQATADRDRLRAQAARVEAVLTKGFDEIVKQLTA